MHGKFCVCWCDSLTTTAEATEPQDNLPNMHTHSQEQLSQKESAAARVETPSRACEHWLTATLQLRGLAPPPVLVSISKTVPKMSRYSVSIDDYLAKASPVFGRMRLDGLTETAVPFAERAVLLWRRGTPTPDMDVDVLIDVLKVCTVSPSVLRGCARCSEFKCASPPR